MLEKFKLDFKQKMNFEDFIKIISKKFYENFKETNFNIKSITLVIIDGIIHIRLINTNNIEYNIHFDSKDFI